MTAIYGGVEAGGTKFICTIGSGPNQVLAEDRFSTTTPKETIARTLAFFEAHSAQYQLSGVGIAAFGPVDLDPNSPTYGYITSTPKPGWGNTDLVGPIGRALNVPVGFDTDVNGAALGEYRWGAAQGLDTFLYLTIGTGIGGGGMVGRRLMHGLIHPEMGHIRLPRDETDRDFAGVCPYHGDCLEGTASGPAMHARWGMPAESLPEDHPAWALEARILAQALANFVCTLSPQRIILGGGVMSQAGLFPQIRQHVVELLNGYVQSPEILARIHDYIVPPGLGNRSGALGAIALGQAADEFPDLFAY